MRLFAMLFVLKERMKLNEMEDCLFENKTLQVDKSTMEKVVDCYKFLRSFSSDKVIYGINTGFGPMAQWRVDDKYLKDLQYN
ncbi:MAG: aromatic amino acid lyase, partial [Bacteroidales bacterium]|nr:aromatic amino acid lyase [Bacteroidales bacterium]